jgi:hypothetical protein
MHLQNDFKQCVRKQFGNHRVSFGHPALTIDTPHAKESFQAGGSVTLATGGLVSYLHGPSIVDSSGLGRWSGITFRGGKGQYLSILTAYRTCTGSFCTAPIGSTFHREYEYFRSTGIPGPRPRVLFQQDLKLQIKNLQSHGHSVIVMLDANATLESDKIFAQMLSECDLHDLHSGTPAPSTYMGARKQRIDFIFGCQQVVLSVIQQGTLSYYEGPQADHRGLYIDLDVHKLLSITMHTGQQPLSSRLLKSGNPELVLHKYYEEHRMLERLEHIRLLHQTYSRDKLRKLLESWDKDQGRAMLHAESTLRKPPQSYQWSPALRNCGILRHYWRLRLREVLHQEVHAPTFDRLQQEIQVYDSSFVLPHRLDSLTAKEICPLFNTATRALTECQQDATNIRFRSYYNLMALYESDTDTATLPESTRKAKAVRKTIAGEQRRMLFHHIRSIMKPFVAGGLSKLLIPRWIHADPELDDDVESSALAALIAQHPPDEIQWETVIEKETMERHLQQYNRQSFRAAAESPCGHGSL